jgi:multidrug efflux system outer membrane protein
MKYGVLIAASLLAGCAPRPAFQRPPVTAPEVYRAGTSETTSIGDQKWFDVFKDESLQELIRKAIADNYDVRIAATRVLEAQTRIVITRSAQFPALSGTGGITTQRSAKSGPFPAFGVTAAQLGVSGSYNADFWGKYRSATDASRANLLAAGWAKQEVLTTLVSNIAAGYFFLRELDLELEISKRTVAARKESLDLIKTLEGHGLVSLIDVRQAEQLVETASAQIPQLERQIEQQENALSVLLGSNPGTIQRGLDIGAQPHLPVVPAGLPSGLLARRPDIQQIEADLIAADAQIAVARAEIFPQISLTATAGFQSSALTRLFSGSGIFGSLAAGLVEPIFNAGRIRANIRLTEQQKQEIVLTYQKTVQEAFREVSDGLIAYRKNREFREEQERLLAAVQDAVRLSNLRYRAGESNYLEVLTNETNVFQAELVLAQARGGELLALVQLYQALGGGWQQ